MADYAAAIDTPPQTSQLQLGELGAVEPQVGYDSGVRAHEADHSNFAVMVRLN